MKKEEKILALWREKKIFEKTLQKTKEGQPYVFYDGPPFATGLPHYGHLIGGTLKDVLPRYHTMKGRHVRRVWGWDCHGLPIENLIEKELKLESKKDIEKYGVGKFNDAARQSVLKYDKEWKEIVPLLGRWVDMENAYVTMDWKYTESVWWAFKELWKKKLLYEGYKSMHICPRCETTLAVSEVGMNYQEVKDLAVYVKFELADEPGTFLVAWTTTPWTLPGNVALAVNPDIEYVLVKISPPTVVTDKNSTKTKTDGEKQDDYRVYVAEAQIGFLEEMKLRGDIQYKIVSCLPGKKLIGKKYKPLFDAYAKDDKLENRENGWQVYSADFVSADEGTGIVHIAPAFGENDMQLAKDKKLPFIQHVGMDGKIESAVGEPFAGMPVKPKGNDKTRLATDIEIIRYLQENNLYLSKTLNFKHSYPHCWRCDTPLLNYAASSWFVNVASLKSKLLSENKKIHWVPDTAGSARFQNWLEGVRDWSVSRARYWGAPIPVWRCDHCEKIKVVGSVSDLVSEKSRNTYLVMRHGEAESNRNNIVSSKVDNPTHLTDVGRREVEKSVAGLKNKKIDLIFASDFLRTKETAEIVADKIGVPKECIIFDQRLREIDTGVFNNRPIDEYRANFANFSERFTKRPNEGENITDVKRRTMDFLSEIDARHEGKVILIVTHEYPAWMLVSGSRGLKQDEICSLRYACVDEDFIRTGEVQDLSFSPYPHNEQWETDLHRPYIDSVRLACDCGGEMTRVPEVFDCWFESGSMPYAQFHYPFENEKDFEKNFPADFIAEGLDQTRGWFYTMLILSLALFGKSAYKNVIVNGIILAEDGQKMSKRLRNYPDPIEMVEKYGTDALRLYLLSSPAVRGEDLNFSEKGVEEVRNKILSRLENVVNFYELYALDEDKIQISNGNNSHVLDEWILSRLDELIEDVEQGLMQYKLDKAVRPLGKFVDDLSTWYVRRSRERMKAKAGADEESTQAIMTLRNVLRHVSIILAPLAPFTAEDIFQRVKDDKAEESVHLESWPEQNKKSKRTDPDILEEMATVRKIVALGLEARAQAEIKVRQPLSSASFRVPAFTGMLDSQLLELIKEEINVKEVEISDGEENVRLDTFITPKLREEGQLREFVRNVQNFRKEEGMKPGDGGTLVVTTTKEGQVFLEKFLDTIKRSSLFDAVEFTPETQKKEVAGEGFLWTLDRK